ncbi:MAG: hypothetical protein JJ934_00005 [Pseudomonadales bacterium]|nr:hypothetical protein [Pseudomonadales bacterium]MBO6597257.1 hypothetical protein [Pseudomonadales bacterium]MBO6655237.1 hypothetical protein [Pseudomonadales bacterium]MBO6703886.1 hypothetical protein [Pseudomonadales bacterium]MBO6823557.1 hypothetical protein [Pseudomonadales bacterium]
MKSIGTIALCLMLVLSPNGFGQLEEAEKTLVTDFIIKFLDAEKARDLDMVARYIALDFVQVSEEQENPDPTLDRDQYMEYIARWLMNAQFYDYNLDVRDIYRLPNGEGYGVATDMQEMYVADGEYVRETYPLVLFVRNTQDGFKLFRLVIKD